MCVWRVGEGMLLQSFHSSLTGIKKCITPYKSLQCRNLNLHLDLLSNTTSVDNYFTALESMSRGVGVDYQLVYAVGDTDI